MLDNWLNHFHDFVKENLARGAKKIILFSLPTYAPWENPVEKLWLKLKKENVVHHPFGGNWEELKKTLAEWLNQYKNGSRDLLHFVGLDTKMERYRSIFATLQEQGRTQELLAMADLLPH